MASFRDFKVSSFRDVFRMIFNEFWMTHTAFEAIPI